MGPDDISSYNSFSDMDSETYIKNPRVSPMGVHINGQYINYACFDNFDDYYLSPEYTGNNNWQDSSLYSSSDNSNNNFFSSFGSDVPGSILLGGGDGTYAFNPIGFNPGNLRSSQTEGDISDLKNYIYEYNSYPGCD